MNWIQTKQPNNLVLPPHSLEYLEHMVPHPPPVTSLVWVFISHICAGPHTLQTCILLITSLNPSLYPHFRELCLCLQLLRCHLWSIELLCLYFYWLQLFLSLFSMAQISVIWGKQVFFFFFPVWIILLTLSKNLSLLQKVFCTRGKWNFIDLPPIRQRKVRFLYLYITWMTIFFLMLLLSFCLLECFLPLLTKSTRLQQEILKLFHFLSRWWFC